MKNIFGKGLLIIILFITGTATLHAQLRKAVVVNSEGKTTNSHNSINETVLDEAYGNSVSWNPKNMCDTFNINAYKNIWTISSYYVGSSPGADGWVNGVNTYGDKAKANYFSNASAYPKILGVYIAFGDAWSSNPQKTISVNIYQNSGGNPGSIIASKSITMQKVMSDVSGNYFTKVMFNAPVSVSGSFFAGVDFSNLSWAGVYDTLSIQSNTHGQTVPTAVWEKQSDNLWYRYNTTYSFALDISLAIFPIVTDFTSQAAFTQSTSSTCPGFNVDFNASGSIQNSVHWVFQGGTPSSSYSLTPTVTYATPGTWPVKLYVWGGACNNIDSASSQITILTAPNPAVTVNPTSVCKGDTSTLTAHNGIFYSWAGFPSGQNPIIVAPLSTTSYTVNVTGSNVCTAAQQVVLTVHQPPVPGASAGPPLICPGGNSLITANPGYFEYLWSNGETNAAFSVTPTSDTTFYVTITDSNGCTNSDSVTVSIDSCLSLNEISPLNEFKIFPNPSMGFLTINFPENEKNIEIQVYDISGKLLLNEFIYSTSATRQKEINLNSLNDGSYIIRALSNNINYSGKLIMLRQ